MAAAPVAPMASLRDLFFRKAWKLLFFSSSRLLSDLEMTARVDHKHNMTSFSPLACPFEFITFAESLSAEEREGSSSHRPCFSHCCQCTSGGRLLPGLLFFLHERYKER